MKVLVIGSGGREHALTWKIKQSPLVKEIFCAPGNGGMAALGECVPIAAGDTEGLCRFAKERSLDLTVVGPEIPLVNGIVDTFEKEGLRIFGPSMSAARIEGSKTFSKKLMLKYGIPTARFKTFTESNKAKDYVVAQEPPYVIKADGLAAGKGVLIAETAENAVSIIGSVLDSKQFGTAGDSIVIEEYLEGDELSVLAFTDGTRVLPLASSQDHKRVYDDDKGPNTGGMGAYSPCPLVSQDDLDVIVQKTIQPLISGLKNEGIVYKGLLYAGLMISKHGPKVLEYNVRFGDPETQAVIPRLKSDIVPLLLDCAEGNLRIQEIIWDHRPCVTVVVASGGYPGDYKKGFPIKGLDKAQAGEDVLVFHAGTRMEEGNIVTNGGRVLGVSGLGKTLKEAQQKAYSAVDSVSFEGCFYRKDIGNKARMYQSI